MQDGLCTIDRHELTDFDWIALGALRAERERLNAPKPEDYGWQKVPKKAGAPE
jgi:hypothetical protein